MKILADVNISPRVVEILREHEFDAHRVSEVMDARSSDREVIEEARRRSAVLISHDQDFSALLAVSGASSPSLINIRVSQVDAGRLAEAIVNVMAMAGDELAAGAVVTLDDAGARIHHLPIS